MKNSIKIIVSLMMGVFAIPYVFAKEENTESKQIIIYREVKQNLPVNRSLGPAVEAWYFPETATIAVTCYGAKETSIYIIDSSGDVAVRDSYDFTISPDCTVYAPIEEGEYWLVLDSEELYAEGVFEVE